MNTYGSAVADLVKFIKPYRDEAYKNHFSSPRYFIELHLATHRGFEAWCIKSGFRDPDQMNVLRVALASHAKHYLLQGHRTLECLLTHIPHEYNVRGKWTPVSAG